MGSDARLTLRRDLRTLVCSATTAECESMAQLSDSVIRTPSPWIGGAVMMKTRRGLMLRSARTTD
jgi:hypothetical protein